MKSFKLSSENTHASDNKTRFIDVVNDAELSVALASQSDVP